MGAVTAQQLATIFAMASTHVMNAQHEILESASVLLENSAKEAIGNPSNPFGWAPLAESTVERKGHDLILLDTGDLKNSIEHNSDGHEAYVGTNLEYAEYQEFGTSKIPARPFLGGAIIHEESHIPEVAHKALAKLFP